MFFFLLFFLLKIVPCHQHHQESCIWWILKVSFDCQTRARVFISPSGDGRVFPGDSGALASPSQSRVKPFSIANESGATVTGVRHLRPPDS